MNWTSEGIATVPQATCINHVLPLELFASIADILYEAESPDPGPLVVPSQEQLATHFKCHPLLNVMLVCKAWYTLITTTPRYWTSFAIGVRGVVGWGSRLPQDPQGKLLAEILEGVLKRSGQLPIQVTVVPGHIPDLAIVTKALSPHTHRLSSLSLVSSIEDGDSRPIPSDEVEGLINTPFPALERFVIGSLGIIPPPDLGAERYAVNLTAPKLRQLACEMHFISPPPSLLTHLSLTRVSFDYEYLELPHGPVEFPQLLELYLSDCEPSEILPTLLTPALQTLIVYRHLRGGSLLPKPPQYANLRELQWSDVGEEECFDEILELSPNLTRYSNYVHGTEEELDLSLEPASIFDSIGIIGRGRETNIGWPQLKEVYLDVANGAGINKLVQAVPSIEFLRILRDPIRAVEDEEQAEEAKLLEEIGRKVALKFGLDSA